MDLMPRFVAFVDKAKDENHAEAFKHMTAAYNVLSDAQARATYDRELLFSSFG